MKQLKLEFFVGLFVIVGLVAVSYMAIKMGNFRILEEQNYYTLTGRFDSVSGLKEGAAVELSGVKVGRVLNIEYDIKRYEAVVLMEMPQNIQLPTDSIASIRTSGIIGDKYIKVTIGGEEDMLQAGGTFEQTESALDIEELISKFVFNADGDK